ncbi:hypothetical protein [Chlorella virus XW01]|nr:hypothetical protein [Chlorella virus XW01]
MSKFKVVETNLIFSKFYNLTKNTNCPYCRCSLMESSTEYYETGKHSKVSLGACGHAYHSECINKWLTKSNDCPICREKWSFNINE